MADISTIKNEIHVASCAELLSLKAEADQMVVDIPNLLNWFLNHVYKEYNRRRYFLCNGVDMIEPYDGGFIPIGYTPTVGSRVLLEMGDAVLLENGDFLILESLFSNSVTVGEISVTDGVATIDRSSVLYEWPVTVGGAGADSGELTVADGMISFTVLGINYQFAAWVGGMGSTSITITDGLATTTIASTNYEWPVSQI